MFLNNIFYHSILLIVYFDNNIDIIECSLLSRAKNPIDIVTEGADTAAVPVYIELPGTLQRLIPTQTVESITRSHATATQTATLAVPEYIVYHNEPIRTSSPSVNVYRYETEKPSQEPENLMQYYPSRPLSALDKINPYKPKKTVDSTNMNDYNSIPRSAVIHADTSMFNQYPISETFRDSVKIHRFEPVRGVPVKNSEKVGEYEVTKRNTLSGLEYKNVYDGLENVNRYQPLRTVFQHAAQYVPGRTFAGVKKVNQYEPLRTSLDNVHQYKPIRTFSAVENINQYKSDQPLRTSMDYVDQYKPARTSSEVDNINQYQPLSNSLNNLDQYKLIRTFSAVENVDQYQPLRTSLDYVDQYKPVRTFSPVENVDQYQSLRTSQDYVDQYKPVRTFSAVENVDQYQPLRTTPDYVDQNKPVRTFSAVEYADQYKPPRTSSEVENINQYPPLRTSPDYVDQNKPVRTFSAVEYIDQYQPLRTSPDYVDQNKPVRTFSAVEYVDQYKPPRTSSEVENINQYPPLRTSMDDVDQYKPARTFATLENDYQYQPSRTSSDNVDQYTPNRTFSVRRTAHQYQPLRTLSDNVAENKPAIHFVAVEDVNQHQPSLDSQGQYKQSRTFSDIENVYRYEPVRTSLESINQYKPGVTFSRSEDYYEPVRKSPPAEEIYRFEPFRTSALPLATYNIKENVNRVVPAKTDPSLDNIYRYELERVSSPVKVYPYFPVRTTILEKTKVPDDNRFEPMRSSPSSEYFNPYEPIKFSALYIDQPSRSTKNTFPNYIYTLDSLTSRKDTAAITQRIVSWKKYIHRLDNIKSTNEISIPSKIPPITNVQKATYQFTPFLANRPPEFMTKLKKIYQFTPYLRLSSASYNQEKMRHEFVNRTKSPDDYWKEFIRPNHDIPENSLYQTYHLTPSEITRNMVKVEGNMYPPLPLETTRPLEEYWNEFIRNEPRRTYKVTNTQVKSSKIEPAFNEDESIILSKLSDIFNQTLPVPLTTSSPISTSYQYVPPKTIKHTYHETYRTPRRQNYIYQNFLKTSRSSQLTYEHVSQSSPISDVGNNFMSSMTSSILYEKVPIRTFVPHTDFFQPKTIIFPKLDDDFLRNRFIKTSSQPPDDYGDEASSSKSSQNFDQNESVTKDSDHHKQPTGTIYSNQSDQAATTPESSDPPKLHQGFRTLWQPTITTTTSIIRPIHIEREFKPSRTTRVFNWNFNDVDAAWPKVELIFSTTKSTTAAIKPSRKFPSYFPFYLRSIKEETTTSSSLNEITNQTNTTIKVSKTTDSSDADHKLMEKFILRQAQKKNNTEVRCYSCGLNVTGVPYFPTCHHVFDTKGSIHGIHKNKYKVNCQKQTRRKSKHYWVSGSRTLYRNGCFKRFVEFGEVYSERGCRTMEPLHGKSFVSYRLAILEKMLKDVDDGCLASPHASLTPFARGISLYARYHVCVCQGRYCNAADGVSSSILLIIFNIFLRL